MVAAVSGSGRSHHEGRLLAHARGNQSKVIHTLRDLPPLPAFKRKAGIVISAGPSLSRRDSLRRIQESGFDGTLITVDAAFAACLRAGLEPDFVLTLDPHPTRMVRWFGDPEWEEHAARDDYFERQDLDIEFRRNANERNRETLNLVDTCGSRTRAIVATSAPANVVRRLEDARMELYWWNPLVDDPRSKGSLTRRLHALNPAPCLNTGGNVGTAAWVFAVTTLGLPEVALVGMDLGYYADTPYEQTQLYYEYRQHLDDAFSVEDCFLSVRFPWDGKEYYTDPTYYWYARNFGELLQRTETRTYNCSEGGTLVAEGLECVGLDDFLKGSRRVNDGENTVHQSRGA